MPTRDTKTSGCWRSYEAHLQDVYFEWPTPFQDSTKKEEEQHCRTYLDTYLNGYKLESFYLKSKEATKK
jgi:hypothetical protein